MLCADLRVELCCFAPRDAADPDNAYDAKHHKRDARNQALLQAAGWNVIVVWECQLSPNNRTETLRELDLVLSRIVLERTSGGKAYITPQEDVVPIAAEEAVEYGKTGHENRKT